MQYLTWLPMVAYTLLLLSLAKPVLFGIALDLLMKASGYLMLIANYISKNISA